MIQRIIKVGNEFCVTLPAEGTETLQLKEGREVTIIMDPG